LPRTRYGISSESGKLDVYEPIGGDARKGAVRKRSQIKTVRRRRMDNPHITSDHIGGMNSHMVHKPA
jgi:hypothetical protein